MHPRHYLFWLIDDRCPNRCVYCGVASGRGARARLDNDDLLRVAGQVAAAGFEEVQIAGGEPLVAPGLPIVLARLKGRCRVSLFSGGGVQGEAAARAVETLRGRVDRIVFSLDIADEAENDRLRGRPGATRDLLRLARLVRRDLPTMDVSFNSVVSRANIGSIAGLWDWIRPFGPSSWSLSLVADNLGAGQDAHVPVRSDLERFYLETVPALAGRLDRDGALLVVLPTPLALLARRVSPARWSRVPGLDAELDDYARGAYNRAYASVHGCPIAGSDLTIGFSGEVYPCSQPAVLQPEYVVGDLMRETLAGILSGPRLAAFREGIPHRVCLRCEAPSNLPGGLPAALQDDGYSQIGSDAMTHAKRHPE